MRCEQSGIKCCRPSGWTERPLVECFSLQRGFDITLADQCAGEVPVVSSSGITSRHNRAKVQGPGVVIGRKGNLGNAYFISGPFWPHDTTLWVYKFHGNDPAFTAYFLKHLRLERFDAATSVPTLNRNVIHPLRVSIPELPEQRAIVRVLDTLDETIRKTQAKVEKNSLIYQGLQERFFAPHAAQKREGWEEVHLEDIADSITSGPRGWACYYADAGDHFLRIGNLTRKHLDLRFDDVVKVQPPAGAEGVRTALAPGDLLISITADLGIIGVVPDWMGVAYINQHIARARLNRSRVDPRFLGYQLAGQIGQRQFYRLNDVGAKAGLNLPTVGRLRVWLPSLPVQNQIATALDTVQESLREDEAMLAKMARLKSGLTSDLLTGRVRVLPI